MGRRSKATQARLDNLSRPEKSKKPTVEEVFEDKDDDLMEDDLLNEGFFFLDEEEGDSSDSSDDEDAEVDEDEIDELRNEAAIDHFNAILFEAQAMAVKAEREAAGEKLKRKRHYSGNAPRTKRHHAQKRRKLEESGQKLISSMFAKAPKLMQKSSPEVIEVTDESSESEDEDEIDASMQRLFANRSQTTPTATPEVEDIGAIPNTRESKEPDAERSPEVEDTQCTAREEVERLLRMLREGQHPRDDSPETEADRLLNRLSHKDFPALRRARAKLHLKAKDKKIDVFFRSRITAMAATLNLYLDPELSYSWSESSVLAAKAMGRGLNHARNLRKWIKDFLHSGKLPLHRCGSYHSSILDDEDFCRDIQLHLTEISKKGYIRAQDIVDYVATPEVQKRLGAKARGIHIRTARRWLHKLSWRYRQKKKGMYIDGHEREDVVEYRKAFVERWNEYEKRFVIYGNDGEVISTPTGFPVPQGLRFRLILVTHDESTFYENDRRKMHWINDNAKPVAEKKGEGQSIMALEFLTSEWGPLADGDDRARLFFKAGKKREGYFDGEDLLKQVDNAIDIFEGRTGGMATGLFLFDNAPSHQRRAPDALSARRMPKGPHASWRNCKDGPKMRLTTFGTDKMPQDFYFPDDHATMPGWFKGMENIIKERGLWPQTGLNAQCDGFKCEVGKRDCCCRRLLFCQPDFVNQKSHLEELITSRGHLCDFYPKYHCELNFIEQYWGAAKLAYRSTPKTKDMKEMEENVKNALDDVPLLQIQRYANRATRFINAYFQGLSGPEAAWANRKYHGHRTLPPELAAILKSEHEQRYNISPALP